MIVAQDFLSWYIVMTKDKIKALAVATSFNFYLHFSGWGTEYVISLLLFYKC